MNIRQWLIVFCFGLVSFVSAIALKFEIRFAWLIAILAALIIGRILVYNDDKHFIGEFMLASPDDQRQLLMKLGLEAKPFIHKISGTFRYDWRWAIINMLSASLLLIGPTLVYSLATEVNFSWDSSFSLVNLLLLFGGFAAWALLRRWRIRNYCCPKCSLKLFPLPNRKLLFECNNCTTLWHVLDVNEPVLPGDRRYAPAPEAARSKQGGKSNEAYETIRFGRYPAPLPDSFSCHGNNGLFRKTRSCRTRL
ncbi:hypothetical protein [Albidovulum sp.]|uniref:hypothetical protein n=1 Tax=Albidovulum sp. TaxID=1872424 RepID=UPI0039B98076